MRILLFAFVPLLAACSATSRPAAEPDLVRLDRPLLTPQTSGTTALLQAVSPVSEQIVWVSGHRGTFARTLDGGATWQASRVPGAEMLEFRDVHAVNADTAYLLSAGSGALSRIFKTTDGGRSWTQQHQNAEPMAFFDCFAFWDSRRGVVFSDAVRGEHFVLLTTDGGAHWERVPPNRLPPALPNEGSFAASGTCVTIVGRDGAIVGTGNASQARALRTADAGRSWTASTVPVVAGDAAGLGSVAFRDAVHGVALGGEIGKNTARGDYVAMTSDGGVTWMVGGRPTFAGPVYGAAYVPGGGATLIAVGPGGANLSWDDGRTWTTLDGGTIPGEDRPAAGDDLRPLGSQTYWSIGFASPRAGWATGPQGRIVKIQLFR